MEIIFLLILFAAVLTVFILNSNNEESEQESDIAEHSDENPYRVNYPQLTASEQKRAKELGLEVPDPFKVIFFVTFECDPNFGGMRHKHPAVQKARENICSFLAKQDWAIHANGRMLPRATVVGKPQKLLVGEEFINDAIPYFTLSREERGVSKIAPHLHHGDKDYCVVWHDGGWYLHGAHHPYVTALIDVQERMHNKEES